MSKQMPIYRLALAIVCLVASVASPRVVAADNPPAWAYPVAPADLAARHDGVPRRVPNSPVTYALPQLRDRFFAPDWHPADYPPMPSIVAKGRKPEVFACGFCHRPDGSGSAELCARRPPCGLYRPADEGLQVRCQNNRRSGGGIQLMIDLAKAATDEEIAAAAAFEALWHHDDAIPDRFCATRWRYRIVVGTEKGLWNVVMYHDSRARFIAYVPLGSVARGELLVKTGGAGKSVA